MADTIPLNDSEPAPEVVVSRKKKSKKGSNLERKRERVPFLVQHPRKTRGVVYINHLPHGFYENQLNAFMSQFGTVTNLRVGRSARTGKFKGYAFVEFLYPEIADIVASTMNNYLMFKKLLKCTVVPKKRISKKIFKRKVKADNPPGIRLRTKSKKLLNKVDVSDETIIKRKAKQFAKLLKLQKKLEEAGIQTSISIPKTTRVPKSSGEKAKTKESPVVHKPTPRPLVTLVTEEKSKSLKRKRLHDQTSPGTTSTPPAKVMIKKSPGTATPKNRKRPAEESPANTPTTPKNLKRRAAETPESLSKTSKKAKKELASPGKSATTSPGTPSTSKNAGITSKVTPKSSKKSPMQKMTTPSTPSKEPVAQQSTNQAQKSPAASKKAKASKSTTPVVPVTSKSDSPAVGKKAKTPKSHAVPVTPKMDTPNGSKKAKTPKLDTPAVGKQPKTPKSDTPVVTTTSKSATPTVDKKAKTPKSPAVTLTPKSDSPSVSKKAKTPKSPAVPTTPKMGSPAVGKKAKTPKPESPALVLTPKTGSPAVGKKGKTPKSNTPSAATTPKTATPAVGKKAKTPKSNSSTAIETTNNETSPSVSKKSKTPIEGPSTPMTPKSGSIKKKNKTPTTDLVSTPQSVKKSSGTSPSSSKTSNVTPLSAKKVNNSKGSVTPLTVKKAKVASPKMLASPKASIVKKGTPGSGKKMAKSPKVMTSSS